MPLALAPKLRLIPVPSSAIAPLALVSASVPFGAECEARSSEWRSQMQWSGSGFDAGRSAIASTDSDCS